VRATISTKGRIVLPAEIRKRDRIEAGQVFDVERIAAGQYRITRKGRVRNEGLVRLLVACPARGWFKPLPRAEMT